MKNSIGYFDDDFNLDRNTAKRYNNEDSGTSYIIPYKDEKAGAMSFAGIIFAEGYITGFADRRSSIKTNNTFSLDLKNKEVTKVFKNDRFVIEFTGTNAIYEDHNFDLEKYYLQNWIDDNIDNFNSPENMCEQLWFYIRANAERKDFDDIVACAGYKEEEHGLICLTTKINYNNFEIKKTVVSPPFAHYDGVELFTAQFTANPDPFFVSDAVEIRKQLELMEDRLEYGDHYKPVCRPWNIEQISYS